MATVVAKNATPNADITSELSALTYISDFSDTRLFIPRVDVVGIAGGGQYVLSVKISNDTMTPVSAVTIEAGQTTAILMGRHPIGVNPGEPVIILIQGLGSDNDVLVTATLFDATPASPEDLDQIIEQMQNLNIVAVKERVVLGPCEKGTTKSPTKICRTPSAVPLVAQRTVQQSPQPIKRAPLMGGN